jgi:hypothetical protein
VAQIIVRRWTSEILKGYCEAEEDTNGCPQVNRNLRVGTDCKNDPSLYKPAPMQNDPG